MSLTTSRWYDFDAYTLESDVLRVVFVPARGAKIASIYDKRVGREWLIQPTRPPARDIPYDADYSQFDMNAWDEMFPTIYADRYPVPGKYKDAFLPDHGEVWQRDWASGAAGESLALSIEGQALPYTLTRTTSLLAPDTLLLNYRLSNHAQETLHYLWAAHPLYAVDAQTEIVLPPSVTTLYNVHDAPPWGAHGSLFDYPHPHTTDGKAWDLRRVGAASLKSCRKFYVLPDQPVSWAELRQSDSGASLRMEWDARLLPYLGLWIDEGTYATVPTVALEPTNAFYDGATLAYGQGRIATLAVGATADWWVRLKVGA
jgi:galactose mutarotase-like enzyme